jgi:micrococcal nuclease
MIHIQELNGRIMIPIISRYAFLALLGVLLIPSFSVSSAPLYRWVNSDGGVQYSDNPPPQGVQHEAVESVSQPSFYRVEKVYDGDTIKLATGKKIRLIGINTPEVAYRNQPEQPGGRQAKEFLQQRLAGKRVTLTFGPERSDKYGRLLAHVFDDQGININKLMLEKGLAHAVIKQPSITHIAEYFEAEAIARRNRLGIWRLPQYQIRPIQQASQYRNSFRRLQGTVLKVEEKKSAWLLHFDDGVKALIRKQYLNSFLATGLLPQKWAHKQLIVRGWVQQSRGNPLIRLRHRYAIESISGDTGVK